jgi:hypothetical protein
VEETLVVEEEPVVSGQMSLVKHLVVDQQPKRRCKHLLQLTIRLQLVVAVQQTHQVVIPYSQQLLLLVEVKVAVASVFQHLL